MVNQQRQYPSPSRGEIMRNFKERRNWGRWGEDDAVGAVNLITVEKRLAALASVRSGRTVSLSRPYPKDPSALNPTPAQHFMRTFNRGDAGDGAVVDYYGFIYHGHTFTHVDALCHIWDSDGIWQGRDPGEAIDSANGATFADVTAWNQGIFTKAVLLDVPKFRGEPYVTLDRPVMGDELRDIAEAQGVSIEPGDALLVYSGREAYQADHSDDFFGQPPSPGLHASCSIFIRDHDVAMLGWDMMDHRPSEYGLAWPVHGVIYSFGVVLLDNALLQPLPRPALMRAVTKCCSASCRSTSRAGPGRRSIQLRSSSGLDRQAAEPEQPASVFDLADVSEAVIKQHPGQCLPDGHRRGRSDHDLLLQVMFGQR